MEIASYVLLLTSVVVARIVGERGYRSLGPDEKLRLMDGFSANRAYSLIPLVVLIGVFYLVMTTTALPRVAVTIGYFVLLVGYVVVRLVLNHQKMVSLAMPASYMRFYAVAQAISMVGVAVFLCVLVLGL